MLQAKWSLAQTSASVSSRMHVQVCLLSKYRYYQTYLADRDPLFLPPRVIGIGIGGVGGFVLLSRRAVLLG